LSIAVFQNSPNKLASQEDNFYHFNLNRSHFSPNPPLSSSSLYLYFALHPGKGGPGNKKLRIDVSTLPITNLSCLKQKCSLQFPPQQSDNSAKICVTFAYLTLFNFKDNKEFNSRLGIFLDIFWICTFSSFPPPFPFPHPFLPLRGREGWE
jgi:hypothetical protein